MAPWQYTPLLCAFHPKPTSARAPDINSDNMEDFLDWTSLINSTDKFVPPADIKLKDCPLTLQGSGPEFAERSWTDTCVWVLQLSLMWARTSPGGVQWCHSVQETCKQRAGLESTSAAVSGACHNCSLMIWEVLQARTRGNTQLNKIHRQR